MLDTSRPLVTVAIPTYNRANGCLPEALRSAVAQTYPNIEIIVSDNCSTDQTEQVVNAFSDPRIRYFKQPKNIGANNNFNFCVEQARGTYFLLLSDDDLIDDDFIESCMNAAKDATDIGIIRAGTRLIDADGTVLGEIPNRASGLSTAEFFLSWFDNNIALYLCSTLFNTTGLKKLGGFHSKHNLFQDVVAEAKLAAELGRVDVYDVKASFRRHSGTYGSTAKIHAWTEDSLYLLDTICDVAPESADILRARGMRYFCKKNYVYTLRLGKPLRNLGTYLMIYKSFDYSYPLKDFLYKQVIKRQFRSVAGKAKSMLFNS